ncbi:MAG TPA: SDR family NAD(P)-dependent oxidoreductase, partial [Chitinophaga sp.]
MNCALVTGGSRGIGRAICLKMAAMGYYVIINYKGNAAAAQETLDGVRAAGSDGALLQFDVGSETDVQGVLGAWLESNKDKQVEVLVNNAGVREDNLLFW